MDRKMIRIVLGVVLLAVAVSGWAYHLTRPAPEPVEPEYVRLGSPMVRLPGAVADVYREPLAFAVPAGKLLVVVLDPGGEIVLPVSGAWKAVLTVDAAPFEVCQGGECREVGAE